MTTDEKSFFCPAPFTNLVQDVVNLGGPCPYNSGCWNFKDTPIAERWSNSAVQKLQKAHLNGEKPTECERCQKEEAANFYSRRKIELDNSRYTYEEVAKGLHLAGPKVMVLRLSNICNFACRTCHAVDSSLLRREGDYYADTYGDSHNRYRGMNPIKEFSSEEMEQLFAISGNLEALEFYGGEPMLNKSHHLFLQKLIDSGKSRNISLFYCTNTSHMPDDTKKKLWSHFKNIHFNMSLDGIHDMFHYIRWPGNWAKTSAVIDYIVKQLSSDIGIPVSAGVNITVSNMNIYNLPEIFELIYQKVYLPGHFPALTTVHEPQYFSVLNIPQDVKNRITQRLLNSPYSGHFQGVLQYMNSVPCENSHWRDFVFWTLKMDRYRNVDFKKTFPEYYTFLAKNFETLQQEFILKFPDVSV